MDLKIIYLSPDELKPYEKNARMHNDEDIEQIIESIKANGFNDPIGIWGKDNLIVEGHGRQIAALKLKIEKVLCIRLDHLSDEQRKDYAIRHNFTTDQSYFDIGKIFEEAKELTENGLDMSYLDDLLKVNEGTIDNDGLGIEKKGDIEFSEVLGEANNYVILQFKNEIDWLQACTLLKIGQAKCYSTRKDGNITEKMTRIGTARVLDGAKTLSEIFGEL